MNRKVRFGVALSIALLLQVCGTAAAQRQGPTQGGASHTVLSDTSGVEQDIEPAVPQPGRAGGTGNPELGRERRPLYRFCKSDLIEINFTFTPEFNQTVIVQPDGRIRLRDAGAIVAEGQTSTELEEAIRSAYSGMLHDPKLTVIAKDFDKPFFIASGEVSHPGKYELRSDTTVAEAVAIAGGFTAQSKHSQVLLFRRVAPEIVEAHIIDLKHMLQAHDLNEDPKLQPGDFLVVPKSTVAKVMRFMPTTSMGMFLTSGHF
jgi:polysaccharide export outer membrane protein